MPKTMPTPEPEHDRERLIDQNQGPGSPDQRKDNRARDEVPQTIPRPTLPTANAASEAVCRPG